MITTAHNTVAGKVSVNDESDLPEGWCTATLEDLGSWTSGGTPSRKIPELFGKGIPWVKSGDLNDGRVAETEEYITDAGLQNSSAKLLPAGTVSIALYGATIGKLGVLEIQAATNQACANCEVDVRIANRWFLFYYLLQQRSALIEAGQGGAQPNLTNQIIRAWPIFLAPLSEQHLIVAKIEELLKQVNASCDRLAKVSKILKRFRQSVLAAACSGRLTEDWRDTHESVSAAARWALKVSPLDSPDLPEIPETWLWRKLEDLSERVSVGHVGPTSLFYCSSKVGIPFVRSQNVRPMKLILDDIQYVTPDFHNSLKKSQLRSGDILIVRVGANRGDTCMVPKGTGALNCANIVFARPLPGISDFLEYYCQSEFGQDQLLGMTTGSAQGVLNTKSIAELPVPVLPEAEQQEIVRRVEALFKLADMIEKRVEAATKRAAKLTQAILAKAFRGELVPTEAEIARREGRDYEPASILLERIKAEREKLATKKSTERPRRINSRKG